ncbi:MAG: methionyl-tRNA formyltransferase [Pirellulales bacterium]|nr:methionyl-tRNA formyltransferase [Pirellulales bacterium]
MRLAMMGAGPFAVPTFLALLDGRHEMTMLVTSPPRFHRGRPVAPTSSIRETAERRGVPIFDPENVNSPEFQSRLAELEADLLVVCDYGQILAPAALAASRLGGVNLHASLLPKYRGAAPINWAIYNGETETGVTVIRMTARLDAGPCIAQSRVEIGEDETAPELESRLAEIGARLVRESVDRLASGEIHPLPQDPALATRAPRLKKSDGEIDWTRPARAIRNQVRAMEPWPRTFSCWHRRDGRPLRIIFGPSSVVEDVSAPPGSVIEAAGDRLAIAAGRGAVAPLSLQPAGKRLMSVAEFLRGHKLRVGDRFGLEV